MGSMNDPGTILISLTKDELSMLYDGLGWLISESSDPEARPPVCNLRRRLLNMMRDGGKGAA